MTVSQEELDNIHRRLFSDIYERRELVAEQKKRFVHYTTADGAKGWFIGKTVWLRDTSVMNDFTEIEHGLNCIAKAYNSKDVGARFKAAVDNIVPGFSKNFETLFNSWVPTFKHRTYIACMSEHEDSEDKMGRLSMWRAYGGSNAIALVLHNTPFYLENDELGVYSYPVQYVSEEGFKEKFAEVADVLEQNAGTLKAIGEENLRTVLFELFQFWALCTKHPGFAEEKEWRIVYSPRFGEAPHLKEEIESIRGVPQVVKKIPLKNIPDKGVTGIELHEVIERIIIGPSDYPKVLYDAFFKLMTDAGIKDVGKKIVVSDIPLRQ